MVNGEDARQAGRYVYEVAGGCLLQRDAQTGKVRRERAAIGSRVVQALAVGHGVVVREDYDQFPRGQSNVYFLDENFELVWTAELPSATDVYANAVERRDGALVCASWECYSCRLSEETGRLLGKEFTK